MDVEEEEEEEATHIRVSATHIRLKSLQQLQGWRAHVVQSATLALAQRTFVLEVCNGYYKDEAHLSFKVQLSP